MNLGNVLMRLMEVFRSVSDKIERDNILASEKFHQKELVSKSYSIIRHF